MYLAAYHVAMPWEKSRLQGQSDYIIQFMTDKIRHPELVNEEEVLDDACSRIPSLKHLVSLWRTRDPFTTAMPKINFACCSLLSMEQAIDDEWGPDNFMLAPVYGDEKTAGECDWHMLPSN